METFSALLAIVREIHRSPVNFPHRGQWRGALMFSLICAWRNSWANIRDAGDFGRHRAHYDTIGIRFTVIALHYLRRVLSLWCAQGDSEAGLEHPVVTKTVSALEYVLNANMSMIYMYGHSLMDLRLLLIDMRNKNIERIFHQHFWWVQLGKWEGIVPCIGIIL